MPTAPPRAIQLNTELEFERNASATSFLKWGKQAFDNFGVVPPETGIVHQVNLEYLAGCVLTEDEDGTTGRLPRQPGRHRLPHHHDQRPVGVVGWGVGGIEAEACMLGQPSTC